MARSLPTHPFGISCAVSAMVKEDALLQSAIGSKGVHEGGEEVEAWPF